MPGNACEVRLAATVVTPVPASGRPLWLSVPRSAVAGEAIGRVLLVPAGFGPRLASYLVECVGMVCQGGGLASHAAILAREALVPCLVGVADLHRLRTADEVRLDVDGGFVVGVWR
jgi:phosphohistidine swiveling domain-containing protein